MANQFPGDFALKEVNLYNHSESQKIPIIPLVKEITLYESIFSSALQATLAIQDIGENLISSMPLVGQEKIEILIGSGNRNYKLNFVIYRIDGRTMSEKNQVYVVSCMSIEGLRNENYRICERVDGVKSEKLIKDVLKRNNFSSKKVVTDDTVFPFDMYVPNWRMFDLFHWLSRRSVPTYKKDSVGFLFYETFEGFNYRSIDSLLDSKEYPGNGVKYKFYQANTNSTGVSENEKYRINNFASPKVFDIHDDLRRGAFSHHAIYLNATRRVYQAFQTTADEFWENSSHLEKGKPYVTAGDSSPVQLLSRGSRFIYRPSVHDAFGPWEEDLSDDDKKYMDEVNKTFEKSFYRYYFLEYNHLDISVPGDLSNRAGNVINISIPSPRKSVTGRVDEDKRISGRYLVAAVKHTILNRSELRTSMTLTRDSYGGKNLPDIKKMDKQTYLDGTN